MEVIKVENLYKQYRLGQISTGSIAHDLNRWWHIVRGKEDPYEKITGVNNREDSGSNDYVWALQDINFSVKQGEVLGIIGRNGAGKSTLLKILSKVTSPTKGNIKVKGRIASLLEVGTGFHPELTGRENIFLNGAILGMTKTEIRSKFDEIVAFSGVEKYIDTPVKRYSSGMYVRLAFAVAAHLEPEILIVDEVLAVGDAEFQKKCLGKMKDVSVEGRTVLFVSHNLGAMKALCNEGLLLEHGSVKQLGEINEVLNLYGKVGGNRKVNISNNKDKEIYFSKLNISSDKNGHSYTNEQILISAFCNSILKVERKVQLCIAILDNLDERIFSVIENLQLEPKSSYRISLEIPGNFLTPGNYSVLIQAYIPPGTLMFDELSNALPFTVIDHGSNFSSYTNYGKVFLNAHINIEKDIF
jgi:lipopolysaccharide transport system ATP-binding protein